MYCRMCAAEIPDGAKYCHACGAPVDAANSTKQSNAVAEKQYRVSAKKRNTTLLLACLGLIGIAGLHRIYVGKNISGIVYTLTCGLFMLGTIYDIYCICSEKFKDGDNYPIFSDESMKSNYYRKNPSNDTNKFVLGIAIFFGVIMFAGIMVPHNHNQKPSSKETTVTQNQQVEKPKAEKKEEPKPAVDLGKISVYTYTPTGMEHSATASYYIVIKNNDDKRIKGSYTIKTGASVSTDKQTGYLDLLPREVEIITGTGTAPAPSTKVEADFKLEYSSMAKKEIDNSLDYSIVNCDINNNSAQLWIYVPQNVSDEKYLAISKEIKRNYGVSRRLTIARFAPVMIKQNNNDTFVIFTNNNDLNFSQVLFYTTDRTNSVLNSDEHERAIIDI